MPKTQHPSSEGGNRQNIGKATENTDEAPSLQKKTVKQLFALWPVYSCGDSYRSRSPGIFLNTQKTKAWPMSIRTCIILILPHIVTEF